MEKDSENVLRREKMKAMAQLSNVLGHEIRGPLGVIRNSVYFLKLKLQESQDEKILKHLRILEEEIMILDQLMEQTLDFGRNREPRMILKDVPTLMRETLMQVTLPENIEVDQTCEEGLPSVWLDPDQMKRVLQNLILNAIQAMPEGGRLGLSARVVPPSLEMPNEKMIEISVQDTGCGIPEEIRENVFEPLFTTKVKSTGLGLTVCRNIVHSHQGSLVLASEAGKGTRASVRIRALREGGE